jgi:Xaa-Pro aminopeptidase
MVFDLKKARRMMEEKKIDCMIATSHDNVYYSSGSDISTMTMLKRLAAVFVPLEGDPVFGVHANEEVTARQGTWIKDVRVYEGGEWEPLKSIEFVANMLKEKRLSQGCIGIELFDMTALCADHLRKLLPSVKFVDCQPIFDKMRSVKTPEELRLLSEANMATAKAITVAFEMAREGDTERDIARNMIDLTIGYGADSIAFVTLGAGPNVSETHHIAADYKIKEGDLLHTDFGAFFKGYMSDISRTAVVGEPDQTQLKAYNVAVEAEWAAAEAMHEGATVMDVHNAVKRIYESKGYPYTRAFIGHAIGIGCHELPFLGPSHGDWILESAMFFEVEPSMAIGHTRVHTEDAFIVGKGPAKNVSQYRDISNMQVIK